MRACARTGRRPGRRNPGALNADCPDRHHHCRPRSHRRRARARLGGRAHPPARSGDSRCLRGRRPHTTQLTFVRVCPHRPRARQPVGASRRHDRADGRRRLPRHGGGGTGPGGRCPRGPRGTRRKARGAAAAGRAGARHRDRRCRPTRPCRQRGASPGRAAAHSLGVVTEPAGGAGRTCGGRKQHEHRRRRR